MNRESRAERLSHLIQLLDSENRVVSRWAHEHTLKEFPNECISIFRERSRTAPEKLKRVSEMYLLLAEEYEKVHLLGAWCCLDHRAVLTDLQSDLYPDFSHGHALRVL